MTLYGDFAFCAEEDFVVVATAVDVNSRVDIGVQNLLSLQHITEICDLAAIRTRDRLLRRQMLYPAELQTLETLLTSAYNIYIITKKILRKY